MAFIELMILAPLLLMVVFVSIDIGRIAEVHNRMENAAREGATVLATSPRSVDSGCNNGRNVVDRVRYQNPDLAKDPTLRTIVEKRTLTAHGQVVWVPFTGCGASSVPIAAGDRVRVRVFADVKMAGPITSAMLGTTFFLERSMEVDVQG